MSDFSFPVISITRLGVLTVHQTKETVTIGRAKMLNRGWYDRMQLIDSDGNLYRITKVRSLGGHGPYWGFTLTYSRSIRLDLEIREEKRLSLLEIKSLICKAMHKNSEIWDSGVHEALSDWQGKIEAAQAFHQIVETLASNQ